MNGLPFTTAEEIKYNDMERKDKARCCKQEAEHKHYERNDKKKTKKTKTNMKIKKKKMTMYKEKHLYSPQYISGHRNHQA